MTDNEYGSVCVKNSGGLFQTVYFETIKDKLNVRSRLVTTAKDFRYPADGDGFRGPLRWRLASLPWFASVIISTTDQFMNSTSLHYQ
jgi:hypothetical protein